MEDILASIRRILNEDEAPTPAPDPALMTETPQDGVLVLDSSMLVPEAEPQPAVQEAIHPMPALPGPAQDAVPPVMAEPIKAALMPDPMPGPAPEAAPTPSLIAPAAAAAASASVESLMRTLAHERSAAVHRGGPTIEDVVRAEIRPLLKDWLDNHLPPMVERLVRAEIERVVGRMAP